MGREFVVLFDNKMGNNSSASSEEGNDQSAMDRDTKVKHETGLETKQDNNETDKRQRKPHRKDSRRYSRKRRS